MTEHWRDLGFSTEDAHPMTMTLGTALDLVTACIHQADAFRLTTAPPYVCLTYDQATELRECLRLAVHQPIPPLREGA